MTANHKMILKVLAAVVIAVIPPTCSYLQATAEMREKNKRTVDTADAGYQTLADSVKELQETVKKQHETIIGLRASIGTMMQIVARQDPGLRLTAPPAPAAGPAFSPLPDDIAAARQEQVKAKR